MTTKISGAQISNYTIETTQLSNTAVASFAVALAPKVRYANVANSAFTVLDDTAVNVGGGYIVITGSDFVSGAQVLIDTTPASAVTFVNSTTLRVQVPAKAAASYNLYVVNPDGGTGTRVSGLTYSTDPTWVTASPLSSQSANTAFSVNLSATGATSYSVAAGSTLPAGTSLLANGYFSGTVTIGSSTTYSFSVVATDAELQDSSKTFQVTVTVTPSYYLYSWGRNHVGQLGINSTTNNAVSSPTQVGSDTTWNNIDGGKFHSIATKTNGTLWVWGSNSLAQLGLNDKVYRSSPVQIGALTNWTLVKGSNYHNTAIKSDGTLWSWGYNANGQLGLNDRVYRSSPTQIGSGTTWLNLAGGGYHNIATKTDGTLWVWGVGGNGRLGLGNSIYRSSPTQVGSATDWSKVFAGNRSSLAIKTTGTLWFAGESSSGISGTNVSGGELLTIVQIGSDTNWSKIDITKNFSAHVLAIKTNGTLWSWGRNDFGQLGTSDLTYKSSPTQVGSGTTWAEISSGWQFSGAIKTDGTLWTWGRNNLGQLGGFAGNYVSSPVQVGVNTTWSKIEDLETSFIAIRS